MMAFFASRESVLLFLISFLICGLLIAIKPFYLHRSHRAEDTRAVQAAHRLPTPRLGGIAVVAAMMAGFFWMTSDALRPTFALLAMSFLPIFGAGLAEDLGFGVSVRGRLFAAAISSAAAVLMLHLWVGRVDIPAIDQILSVAPIAVVFTIFATTGVCNAFNLIDGVNGMAAFTGIMVALGLGGIAWQAGDPDLAKVAFALAPAILGFLVFNFPLGKIFLGDAGAYTMGHALAWTGVIVMAYLPEVSPWAIVLVFFWPLAETLFSIYRRFRSGRPVDSPDRMHFHQLVMRGIEIGFVGRRRRHIANPLTALVLLPFIGAPIATGVLCWDRAGAAALAVAVFGAFFVATYVYGCRFFRYRARSYRRYQRDFGA